MSRRRAVLDTNVLVSALLFGGPPRRALEHVLRGSVSGATSMPLLAELREVLERDRFGFSPAQAEQVAEEIRAAFELVHPEETVDAVPADPEDNRVLECAVAFGADVIVSGDRHLLALGSFRGIQILSVQAFLRSLDPPTD